MRNLFIIGTICIAGFSACAKDKELRLINPIAVDRIDETIVLSHADMVSRIGDFDHDYVPLVIYNDEYIPAQVDDLDKDGKWDELAFLIDIKASDTITVKLRGVAASLYPEYEKRTNVRLGILKEEGKFKGRYVEVNHYEAPSCRDSFKIIAQGEGVSWENDKMAFRNYFDCRNVKDLFGKLKPGMIIDKVHTAEMPDYHKLADWGMDILHCGSSVGSGGLALLENDSLHRLGSTDSYVYQKIVEGPVRSIFELQYTGWHVGSQNLSAVERITIYPGKYWFQSDVTVTGTTDQKQIATGIVTSQLKNEPVDFEANNDFRAIATLDVQSLNNDELGMAVLLKKDVVTKVARTTDIDFYSLGYKTVDEKKFSNVISQTYYAAQKINPGKPARHYFFAVWGLENEKWKSMDHFKAYISSEAELLSHPIVLEEK